MFCHKCGTQLPGNSNFCHKCGMKIILIDTTQPAPDTSVSAVEPRAVNTAELSQQAAAVPVQTNVMTAGTNDFKDFVDNHVRTTTKFLSADDLLKNSKPLTFIWVGIGIPSILGFVVGGPMGMLILGGFIGFVMGGALGVLILGGFIGYVPTFIASGIIRMRYRGRFGGKFIGEINIEELIIFLNEHLKLIHPYFHEWGYLTKKGLLPILENAIANAAKEIRICSEFGSKEQSLIAFYIKPKTVDAKPEEMLYYVDALKNGFLLDGRAAGFLGHGTLIRTAPILQAAMEYYLKNRQHKRGGRNDVLS